MAPCFIIIFVNSFAPKKKKSASKNLVAISSEDIENCPLEFHAIEDLLVKIINQELNENIIDLKNARIKLCDSSQYHQKLDNFINTYQKARYSTGGKTLLSSSMNLIKFIVGEMNDFRISCIFHSFFTASDATLHAIKKSSP